VQVAQAGRSWPSERSASLVGPLASQLFRPFATWALVVWKNELRREQEGELTGAQQPIAIEVIRGKIDLGSASIRVPASKERSELF
jgi:hypothetical protein